MSFVCLFLEALGHSLPVDNVPDGVKVFGLAVLVLQVVGVLPSIDTKKRLEVAGDRVLVRASDDAKGAAGLVLDQPGPTAALDSGQGGVDLLAQGVEGAKVLLDGLSQFAVGLTTAISAGRGEVLPEERVVDVATAVEVDQGSLSSSLGIVALGVGILDGLESSVEAVDVGLVVLGVVKLHDLCRDVGLKGAVVVRDVW